MGAIARVGIVRDGYGYGPKVATRSFADAKRAAESVALLLGFTTPEGALMENRHLGYSRGCRTNT